MSEVLRIPFPKARSGLTRRLSYWRSWPVICFRGWVCSAVGIGTLFAMIYVGLVVKYVTQHIGWFDRVLSHTPGFHRYLFGLLRFITRD